MGGKSDMEMDEWGQDFGLGCDCLGETAVSHNMIAGEEKRICRLEDLLTQGIC